MKKLLYIVRTDADFERGVCLTIAGKKKYEQHFVFVGDSSPFYNDGIQNKFQKELFSRYGFTIKDFCDYSILGRILKRLAGKASVPMEQFLDNKSLVLQWIFNALLRRYLNSNKTRIVERVLQHITPDIMFTDQSITDAEYLPEIFRAMAHRNGTKVYIFPHGAAGGLHYEFSKPKYSSYANYKVLASNKIEATGFSSNRIILGDMCSSYPYVHFLNEMNIGNIEFLEDRKYKIAFLIGGRIQSFTSTNSWSIQEEIIIDLSERDDVAMLLKLHPREASYVDLRMLRTFDNLLIVGNETDRSRVTKWADIVVCNDHTSIIFEPMVLGKKVVAIEGKHTPKYKNIHSPLKHSSVTHITSANEFELENIPNADPEDPVTNTVAWGGNGNVDLADLCFKHIERNL